MIIETMKAMYEVKKQKDFDTYLDNLKNTPTQEEVDELSEKGVLEYIF